MKILLVEDNNKVAKFIVKGLREEGYSVDHCEDGNDVIPTLTNANYDLMVLDIMLPGQDGIAITRELRKQKKDLPILLLTARDSIEDKVIGLDAGADDYLPKPFAFAEFLARIRSLLRRSVGGGGGNEAEIMQIADLRVDQVSRHVDRGGRRIELTAKEYSLLLFLLRNKGRVLSRTSIIEHVWEMNFDSGTNVVDVYIRHLRGKLDDDFEVKLIHTVRGVGYVMRVE